MSVINNIVKNDVTYAIQDARVDSITEVFEAEYNVTTFATVLAKWNAGWTIKCLKGSNVLDMVDYSAGTFSFAATLGSSDLSTLQYSVAKLSASGWSADSENIQNKLTAGTNITISGNTISATGGSSYTADAPITIDDGVIGIDTDTTTGLKINSDDKLSIDTTNYIQAKLTAGNDVTLTNNTVQTIYGGQDLGSIDLDKQSLDITPVASTSERYPSADGWIQYDVSSAFTAAEVTNIITTMDGTHQAAAIQMLPRFDNDGEEYRVSARDCYKDLVSFNPQTFNFYGSAENDRGQLECWFSVSNSTPSVIVYANDSTLHDNLLHMTRFNPWFSNIAQPIDNKYVNAEMWEKKSRADEVYNKVVELQQGFYNDIYDKAAGTYTLQCVITEDSEGNKEYSYGWVSAS